MIAETAARLRENIQKVIIGKDGIIDLALIALLCEGHLLLEDVPGTGKTTLAKTIAASLGCTFRRVQFTPDLLPSDLTGIYYFNQKAQEFEYRSGPIMSQILLADEINRATPRTQSALLEAMQEQQVTVDITTHKLPRPFLNPQKNPRPRSWLKKRRPNQRNGPLWNHPPQKKQGFCLQINSISMPLAWRQHGGTR